MYRLRFVTTISIIGAFKTVKRDEYEAQPAEVESSDPTKKDGGIEGAKKDSLPSSTPSLSLTPPPANNNKDVSNPIDTPISDNSQQNGNPNNSIPASNTSNENQGGIFYTHLEGALHNVVIARCIPFLAISVLCCASYYYWHCSEAQTEDNNPHGDHQN